MSEYTPMPDQTLPRFPRGPRRFGRDPRTYLTYECNAIPSYMIRFSDAGRQLQAEAYVGPHATDRTGAMLLSALDSLKVRPTRKSALRS